MFRLLSIALLVSVLGGMAMASDGQNVQATVTGALHRDHHGFFFQIDGMVYDLYLNEDNRADMHKFYDSLGGDMATISGELHVQEVKDGKPYMVVYANNVSRLRVAAPVAVTRVEPAPPPPVIVREHYVEHRHIDLPFIHIGF